MYDAFHESSKGFEQLVLEQMGRFEITVHTW